MFVIRSNNEKNLLLFFNKSLGRNADISIPSANHTIPNWPDPISLTERYFVQIMRRVLYSGNSGDHIIANGCLTFQLMVFIIFCPVLFFTQV